MLRPKRMSEGVVKLHDAGPFFKDDMKILFVLLFLVSCGDKNTVERTSDYVLPAGLADCRIYKMSDDYGNSMKVVRCPKSDTTTSYSETCGKNCNKTVSNSVVE